MRRGEGSVGALSSRLVTAPKRMLWALAAGVLLGLVARSIVPADSLTWFVDNVAQPLGQIFLRLLFMLVVPILFSALVIGVSELGVGHLGRLGGRMLGVHGAGERRSRC